MPLQSQAMGINLINNNNITHIVQKHNHLCAVEVNLGSQACDSLVCYCECVCKDSIDTRWDLAREFNVLDYFDLALVERAIQLHIFDLIAKIYSLLDEGDDVVIFDLEIDVGALGDGLLNCAVGGNGKCCASCWRVWRQIHRFNFQEVVSWRSAEF